MNVYILYVILQASTQNAVLLIFTRYKKPWIILNQLLFFDQNLSDVIFQFTVYFLSFPLLCQTYNLFMLLDCASQSLFITNRSEYEAGHNVHYNSKSTPSSAAVLLLQTVICGTDCQAVQNQQNLFYSKYLFLLFNISTKKLIILCIYIS